MKTVRCAIYTRKSSDEGLEQSFNSLDAQREACAAYILSQASEGWSEVADLYDDGGLSGGTLERPALKRLLADIVEGRVDIIVVYKVDRLTRSLLDFAKLVEAFDKAGVSFVSVTQSFNTTTSMGRLTLNMLLSFAQFEREVTAERIRDKIAASKAKGMWMGGIPPLGYKPDGRTLAIVEEHAVLVREIYRRYLTIGNVRLLAEQLAKHGLIAPMRTLASGKVIGGAPLSRGQLYLMLKSPIYIGEVPHKQQSYPGLHAALIDRPTWDAVQKMLADNLQGAREGARACYHALLAGKVFDKAGLPLVAVHATKPILDGAEGGKVRYRYYVSRPAEPGGSADGIRIPAKELEGGVVALLASYLSDPLSALSQAGLTAAANWQRGIERCDELAGRLAAKDGEVVQSIVRQVRLMDDHLLIDLDISVLAHKLGLAMIDGAPTTLQLRSDAKLIRTRRAMRLVTSNGIAMRGEPDVALVKLVAKAHRWWGMLRTGAVGVTELAAIEGVTRSYLTRVTRLAFLGPKLTGDIIAGNLPARLGAKLLTAPGAIDLSWKEQRRLVRPDALTVA